MGAKILIWDIESSPNLCYAWGVYDQNIIKVLKPWYVLCFAAKWLGEEETKVYSLPDYKGYVRNRSNDKALLKDLWKLLDEADIVVAHNGDAFDTKKVNARFMVHHMKPPSPYKSIDTLKVRRRYTKTNYQKLDSIGEELGLGRKVKHEGFELWEKCMAGDMDAWGRMAEYNIQDVDLLEKVYLELRPWMENHPNLAVITGNVEDFVCNKCLSPKVQFKSMKHTQAGSYRQFKCLDCGGYPTERTMTKGTNPKLK